MGGEGSAETACPTCGPTTTEPHPNQTGIVRCANCKEWLRAAEIGGLQNWNPNTMGPDCDWCGECVWCDPYGKPVGVFEGARWHMHSEPICADPDCVTYLTRPQMAEAHRGTSPVKPTQDTP